MSDCNQANKFTYQRVRDSIKDILLCGELAIGDRLPPIRKLAERFGCNYHTVRKGMELLLRENFLESRTGSGIFVCGGSRAIPIKEPASGAESVLAVVSRPPTHPNDVRFIASLHSSAEKRNFFLEVHTVSSFAAPKRIFDRIVLRGCAAILLPLIRSNDNIEEIAECIDQYAVPFAVGTPYPGLEKYCYESPEIFGLSTQYAIEMVFQYFLCLGYGNIVLLLPADEAAKTVVNYIVGYTRQCQKNNLAIRLELCDHLPAATDSLLQKWEKQRGNIAVICYDDDVAVRLMDSARRLAWSIPEDIALTGLGDTALAAAAIPPLSSVQFPFDYVTNAIIDCALALKNDKPSQRTEPICQHLVIRKSCGGHSRLGKVKAAALLNKIRESIQQHKIPEDA